MHHTPLGQIRKRGPGSLPSWFRPGILLHRDGAPKCRRASQGVYTWSCLVVRGLGGDDGTPSGVNLVEE